MTIGGRLIDGVDRSENDLFYARSIAPQGEIGMNEKNVLYEGEWYSRRPQVKIRTIRLYHSFA